MTFLIGAQIPSDSGLNASVQVQTTGIQTLVNCNAANAQLTQTNSTSFKVEASDSNGCSATTSFNPQDAEQQYGVVPTDPGTCGLPPSANLTVVPVMFWFFEFSAPNQQQPIVKTVLCQPQIALFDVAATVNYNNGSLTNVTPLNNYTASNNISDFLATGQGDVLNGSVESWHSVLAVIDVPDRGFLSQSGVRPESA